MFKAQKYDLFAGSILMLFRKIPNGEFLVNFGSIIFDPLWGPTAELKGVWGGGAPPVQKVWLLPCAKFYCRGEYPK